MAQAATLLAHDDPFPGGSVVPPIYQTSLFTFTNYAEMADAFAGRKRQPMYSRGDNPTVMEFEKKIAALEGAEAARAFSSGMGAISAMVLAFVGAGERIVSVRNCYGDAYRLFERLSASSWHQGRLCRWLRSRCCRCCFAGRQAALSGKPKFHDVRIAGHRPLCASLAKQHGVVTTIDNSWATPLFQKPISHGIDLVMHSASKYLGGHSDTVAGVVAGSQEMIDRINGRTYSYLGAKLSPFEAWLLLRGLRTLTLRLPHHMKSGLIIAERLKGARQCRAGHAPGLFQPSWQGDA